MYLLSEDITIGLREFEGVYVALINSGRFCVVIYKYTSQIFFCKDVKSSSGGSLAHLCQSRTKKSH